MTKIVSFINRKGGVGKTTIAVNLAGYLAKENDKKVLVIDLDPQASASAWLMTQKRFVDIIIHNEDKPKNTSYQIFDDAINHRKFFDISNGIQYQVVKNKDNYTEIHKLDLIAADSTLDNVEREIVNYNDLKISILYDFLKNEVAELEYDYILIDCPPNFNTLTRNAIFASDVFLIPIIPDQLSIQGFPELIAMVEEILEISNKRRDDKNAPYCGGLIISHYRRTIASKDTIQNISDTLKVFTDQNRLDNRAKIFHTYIRYLTGIPDCQSEGSILATSRKSVASQTEFSSLAKEFIEHIN